MRIRATLIAIVIHGLAVSIATIVTGQQADSLPPQIDSRSHFVLWADVDQVSFQEALKWAKQTELGPLIQVGDFERYQEPAMFLQKLRDAGAKRVYFTSELTFLFGNLSSAGMIIRCAEPARCAAKLEADPLLPGQVLKATEDSVLLGMSADGLEALAEIEGKPGTQLAAALESRQDKLGFAAAVPAAVLSVALQSATVFKDSPTEALQSLRNLQWIRIAGSPPASELQAEAVFEKPEEAAEFAQKINQRISSFANGELLTCNQERVTLSKLSSKTIAAMGKAAQAEASRVANMNSLRQLLLAIHNFESATGALPPQALTDKAGKRLLSWRVLILPYLGEQELYEQFHLDEAWDSPHNLTLLEKLPRPFRAAGDEKEGQPGHTRFVAPLTANSIMGKPGDRCRFQDITDGTSNTILLLQAAPAAAVPWTKPDDLVVDEANPLAGMLTEGQAYFLAAFADGSTRALSAKTDPESIKAFISRGDGEVVPPGTLDD